jgi:hypothetical protein
MINGKRSSEASSGNLPRKKLFARQQLDNNNTGKAQATVTKLLKHGVMNLSDIILGHQLCYKG